MSRTTKHSKRRKRSAQQSSICEHPASITVSVTSTSPHAGQHFCVMCGARLSSKVPDKKKQQSSIQNNQSHSKPVVNKPNSLARPLTGREIGITEYATDKQTFICGAVVKSRCTDFVVEEIRWNGTIVSTQSRIIDPENCYSFSRNFTINRSSTVLRAEPTPNLNKGSTKFFSENQHNFGSSSNKNACKPSEAMNARVILVKANCSTFEAIRMLSSATGISPGRFTLAGLKDTKAVTAQELIVVGASPEKLVACVDDNKRLRLVVDTNGSPTYSRLFPGASRGNRFQIVLRNVDDVKSNIEHPAFKIARQLKERGFINYFGEQRFGGNTTRNTESKLVMTLWVSMIYQV